MSADTTSNKNLAFIGGILAMLTAVGFAYSFYESNRPAPLGQSKGADRKARLEQLATSNDKGLREYSELEGRPGVYNLPIAQAMEIVAAEWENPINGRRKLIERVENATPIVEEAAPANGQ